MNPGFLLRPLDLLLGASVFPGRPPSSGSEGGEVFYQCESVNTAAGTWTGKKWELSEDGVYALSETTTEGLTILGLPPVVGRNYSADTKIKADRFWKGINIPEDGLKLYIPLDEYPFSADTGQTLAFSGNLTKETIDGVPCAYFDGNSWIEVPGGSINDSEPEEFTESLWLRRIDTASDYYRMAMTSEGSFSDGLVIRQISNLFDAEIQTDHSYFYGVVSQDIYDPTIWHHVCYRSTADGASIFVDGVLSASSGVIPQPNWEGKRFYGKRIAEHLRQNWIGYMAGIRSYNRALSDDEILSLAREFTSEA